MATEEGQSWRTRSDATAQKKGVGVLIDTEYLASENEDRRRNPYYIVVDDVRYYGSTPEAAVEAARESDAVKGSVKGEGIFKAQKQVSTALPSQRERTMRNRAAAVAGRAKNIMGRGLNATRKVLKRAPKAPTGAVGEPAAPSKKGLIGRTTNTLRNMFSRKPKGQQPLNGAKSSPAPAAPTPPAPTPSETPNTPLLSPEGLAA